MHAFVQAKEEVTEDDIEVEETRLQELEDLLEKHDPEIVNSRNLVCLSCGWVVVCFDCLVLVECGGKAATA